MARLISNPFRICPVCGGSLQDSIDDPGWVKCFACSRSFDAQTIEGASTISSPPPTAPDGLSEGAAEAKRRIEDEQGKGAHARPQPYVRRVMH